MYSDLYGNEYREVDNHEVHPEQRLFLCTLKSPIAPEASYRNAQSLWVDDRRVITGLITHVKINVNRRDVEQYHVLFEEVEEY